MSRLSTGGRVVRVLDIGARTGGPGPTHGWLGCCYTHDLAVEQEQDRQEQDLRLCTECGLTVDPATDEDAVDTDDPGYCVCELCRAIDTGAPAREPDWAWV